MRTHLGSPILVRIGPVGPVGPISVVEALLERPKLPSTACNLPPDSPHQIVPGVLVSGYRERRNMRPGQVSVAAILQPGGVQFWNTGGSILW